MYSCSRNVARAAIEKAVAELKGLLPTDDMLPHNACVEGAVIRSKGTVANCILEKGSILTVEEGAVVFSCIIRAGVSVTVKKGGFMCYVYVDATTTVGEGSCICYSVLNSAVTLKAHVSIGANARWWLSGVLAGDCTDDIHIGSGSILFRGCLNPVHCRQLWIGSGLCMWESGLTVESCDRCSRFGDNLTVGSTEMFLDRSRLRDLPDMAMPADGVRKLRVWVSQYIRNPAMVARLVAVQAGGKADEPSPLMPTLFRVGDNVTLAGAVELVAVRLELDDGASVCAGRDSGNFARLAVHYGTVHLCKGSSLSCVRSAGTSEGWAVLLGAYMPSYKVQRVSPALKASRLLLRGGSAVVVCGGYSTVKSVGGCRGLETDAGSYMYLVGDDDDVER